MNYFINEIDDEDNANNTFNRLIESIFLLILIDGKSSKKRVSYPGKNSENGEDIFMKERVIIPITQDKYLKIKKDDIKIESNKIDNYLKTEFIYEWEKDIVLDSVLIIFIIRMMKIIIITW